MTIPLTLLSKQTLDRRNIIKGAAVCQSALKFDP